MALKEISEENQEAGDCNLAIDGEFNIYAALEIKEALDTYLPKHNNFVIDLSSVTDIDSSGIQILLAFSKAAENSKKTFSIKDPSSSVKTLLELFNANDQFKLLEETV